MNEGRGDKVAILWEGNEMGHEMRLTYKDVLDKTCQLANYLRKRGVKKGDRVCIYMPMVPELPIAMLACARIGAIHSVVFGGFSAESLAGRILDCQSDVLLSCSAVQRGNKSLNLKVIVDAALHLCLQKANFQPGEEASLTPSDACNPSFKFLMHATQTQTQTQTLTDSKLYQGHA